MKRLLTIFALMLLICSLLASTALGAECGREKVNVIDQGTITIDTEDTNVTDYIANLTDGDKNTGIKSSNKDNSMPIKIEFSGSGQLLEDIIITVISADNEGLASGATGLASRPFGASLTVYIYPVDATEAQTYQITPANNQNEVKIDLSTYQKTVKMVEIYVNCNGSANHPIWEIETNKYEGNHNWELSSTIEPASCTNAGLGIYSCSCGAEEEREIPKVQHSFSWVKEADSHYKLCSVCGTRESESAHEYDHDCDTDCNVCYRPRAVEPHTYRAGCATVCEKCGGAERTPEIPNHLYYQNASCDEYCDLCFEKRTTTIEHEWDNACDSECNNCKGTREVPPHVYTNDAPCDIVCDECGAERTVTELHRYTNDAECDQFCDVCNTERVNSEAHYYNNACAAKCKNCGYTRTTETDSSYSAEHSYDNPCDPDCNFCFEKRTVGHEYDSPCDDRCNKCNGQRQASKHNFPSKGEESRYYTLLQEPTETVMGIERYTCKACGKIETREIPMLEPEDNTPIIIAIIVSVVVIVVCAVIAVIFLVIKPRIDAKKKRIADYLRAQEEQRIAEEKALAEEEEQRAREELFASFSGGSMYDDGASADTTNAFAGIGIGAGTGDDGLPTDGLNDDPSDDFVSDTDETDDEGDDTADGE